MCTQNCINLLDIYCLPTGFWVFSVIAENPSAIGKKKKKSPNSFISVVIFLIQESDVLCHHLPSLAGLLPWHVLHACKHISSQVCMQALVATQGRHISSSCLSEHSITQWVPGHQAAIQMPAQAQVSVLDPTAKQPSCRQNWQAALNSSVWRK